MLEWFEEEHITTMAYVHSARSSTSTFYVDGTIMQPICHHHPSAYAFSYIYIYMDKRALK